MRLDNGTDIHLERDHMAGAWLVETFIVALVLLLVGKLIGIAITLFAIAGALALAVALMLLWDFAWRQRRRLTTKRRR
jgi:O-antigen/teichoic acid export membrane protein